MVCVYVKPHVYLPSQSHSPERDVVMASVTGSTPAEQNTEGPVSFQEQQGIGTVFPKRQSRPPPITPSSRGPEASTS